MATEHPIVRCCRILGISVPVYAERANTTRQTVNRIIRGKQDPSMDMVRRLCAASDGILDANDFLVEPAE